MVVAKFTRDTFNQAWSTARLTRATPSSVLSLQPILSLPQKNFTPSCLVVIAAVFVSCIMKGRPTTGPVWALKKKYTYIRFMFRFRWNIKRCLRKKLKCSWVFFQMPFFVWLWPRAATGPAVIYEAIRPRMRSSCWLLECIVQSLFINLV